MIVPRPLVSGEVSPGDLRLSTPTGPSSGASTAPEHHLRLHSFLSPTVVLGRVQGLVATSLWTRQSCMGIVPRTGDNGGAVNATPAPGDWHTVAAGLGVSSPVSAAQVQHVQAGQQWTVEIEISSGQYGTPAPLKRSGRTIHLRPTSRSKAPTPEALPPSPNTLRTR